MNASIIELYLGRVSLTNDIPIDIPEMWMEGAMNTKGSRQLTCLGWRTGSDMETRASQDTVMCNQKNEDQIPPCNKRRPIFKVTLFKRKEIGKYF
jgi:hypothetical protein